MPRHPYPLAHGQVQVVYERPFVCLDNSNHAEYTLGATAPGDVFELTVPNGAQEVMLQAIDQNIRFTLSPGAPPTQTSGFRLTAGRDPIRFPVMGGSNRLRFIGEAADAILQVQWGA